MKNSKKILASLLVLITVSTAAFCQDSEYLGFNDSRNDSVFVEVGTLSGVGLIVDFFGALVSAIADTEIKGVPLTLSTGYEHCFNNVLLVGGYTSYEFLNLDAGLLSTFVTIGAQYGGKRVKLYHKLALGAATVDFSSFNFNGNLTVIGVKLDIIQGLYTHAEFNIGGKGFLTAGLDYRF